VISEVIPNAIQSQGKTEEYFLNKMSASDITVSPACKNNLVDVEARRTVKNIFLNFIIYS